MSQFIQKHWFIYMYTTVHVLTFSIFFSFFFSFAKVMINFFYIYAEPLM